MMTDDQYAALAPGDRARVAQEAAAFALGNDWTLVQARCRACGAMVRVGTISSDGTCEECDARPKDRLFLSRTIAAQAEYILVLMAQLTDAGDIFDSPLTDQELRAIIADFGRATRLLEQ